MTVEASVVIPTRGRPRLLQRCLEALAVQDFDPRAFEVVVVDDGASADTERVVDHFDRRSLQRRRGPRFRYLAPSPSGRGPAAARNAGWRAAGGNIIAFTDDDCVPLKAWLSEGVAAFEEGVAGVSGRILMPLPGRPPRDYQASAVRLAGSRFVTANCFYRREELEGAGGFDERFRVAWREDSDLFFTLIEKRRFLVEAPHAQVIHPVRPAGFGVSLKQEKKVLFDALLYRKHPLLYRREIRPAPAWRYYLIVAALAVAAAGGIAGLPALAAGGGLAWCLLTAAFCARRLRSTSRAPDHVAEMVLTSALIPPISVFWRLLGAIRFWRA